MVRRKYFCKNKCLNDWSKEKVIIFSEEDTNRSPTVHYVETWYMKDFEIMFSFILPKRCCVCISWHLKTEPRTHVVAALWKVSTACQISCEVFCEKLNSKYCLLFEMT